MQEKKYQQLQAFVYIIDDDASVRDSLEDLLQSIGLEVKKFESTHQFLAHAHGALHGCLVLDVRMPKQSGLAFQKQMQALDIHLPVIFITGHGDVAMSVLAMKRGAVDFLLKPFKHQDLIDAIQIAMQKDKQRVLLELEQQHFHTLWNKLNHGEQEVIKQVAKGCLNKQIAAQLHLSEITIKVRRASAMRKLELNSIIELIHFLEKIK